MKFWVRVRNVFIVVVVELALAVLVLDMFVIVTAWR